MEPWQVVSTLAGAVAALSGLVYKGQQAVIADKDRTIAKLESRITAYETEFRETVRAKDMEIAEWRRAAQSRSTTAEPRP